MSHRNHFPRRDLYAYGFKEGEAWGDDRRSLENALWEIDQLERQTAYEYYGPSPNQRSSAWCPSPPLNGRYHDVQITRSNSDLYSESGMSMTSLSSQTRYNDDSTFFDGYQRGHAHRTYPSSHAVPLVFRGYPSSRDYQSPHYAPPLRPSHSHHEDFRDSIGMSHSSYHQNRTFAPSMARSRTSYDPSYRSQYYSHHSPATQRISTPEQLQMVTRRSSQNEAPSPEHAVDPRHASVTPAPPNMMSPHWSMIATEGTVSVGSESPSVTSSRGMYGQDLRDTGYVGTASRTSGYVESFNVYPHDEFSDISEGVESDDAGYYYASSLDPEEFFENDEYFSEGF